ncbi:MAG: hypothetical protein JWL61_4841 [Gemmatimonadetes bacterium]|jgi:hypothetical protein|nr:hypothetical protein [Gemmatimonadota bacterium]
MFTFSSIRRAFAPLAAAMLVPLAAHAQETQLFSWSGRVDREVQLTIRGSQASNTYENSIQSRARFRVNSTLPTQDGTLRVVREAGRGDVAVVQQPSANNGYTAIVRIVDNEGGADNYRISAYYTPVNDGRYARRNGRDNQGNINQGNANQGRDDNRGRDNQNRDDRYGRGNGNNGNNGNYGNQDAAALRWSGDVDGEVLITWRGNDVGQRIINGAQIRRAGSNVLGNPMQAARGGQLAVSTREGRGRIEVVQQPTAQNRFTSIIRIIDPERGYGHYDFTASLR